MAGAERSDHRCAGAASQTGRARPGGGACAAPARVVLAALAALLAALAGASAQTLGAGRVDGGGAAADPPVVRMAFEPYSVRNSPEDPGTFVVLGVLTVQYDLSALEGIVNAAAVRPGRYEDAAADAAAARTNVPVVSPVNDVFTEWRASLFYASQDGEAFYSRALVAHVRPPTDFSPFPFDVHEIPLVFTVVEHTRDVVDLVQRDEVFVDPMLEAYRAERTGLYEVRALPARDFVDRVPMIGEYASVLYRYQAKRHIVFYLYAAFVPTLLVVSLVCLVPWLKDVKIMDAARLNATVVLAIFANMLVMDAHVPDGNYLTVNDGFSLFVVVFATAIIFAEYLLTHVHGDPARWRRAVRLGSVSIYGALWIVVVGAVAWHVAV